MGRKKRLFSIGEISRFTGASIKSLRYYESIKILKPAFVDPHSGYRYYSLDQVYLIDIIMFCIELDIPLKDLTGYIDKSQTVNVRTLLAHGKGIAQAKLETLQRGLKFIEDVERQIALVEEHKKGRRIYTREIPEKYFWAIPVPQGKSFDDDVDFFEIFRPFWDFDSGGIGSYEFMEYGLLCEHSPGDVRRYAFMELPRRKAETKADVKVIPAGAYFCSQGDASRIERASQVFGEELNGAASFLAIETEVFTGKYKINNPINELRVIGV